MASRAVNVRAPAWRETVQRGAVRSGALAGSVALIVATLLVAVAVVT